MEMGLKEDLSRWVKDKEQADTESVKRLPDRDFLKRRLENEINALYDRLTQALKEENERLRMENLHLKSELDKYNRA